MYGGACRPYLRAGCLTPMSAKVVPAQGAKRLKQVPWTMMAAIEKVLQTAERSQFPFRLYREADAIRRAYPEENVALEDIAEIMGISASPELPMEIDIA